MGSRATKVFDLNLYGDYLITESIDLMVGLVDRTRIVIKKIIRK